MMMMMNWSRNEPFTWIIVGRSTEVTYAVARIGTEHHPIVGVILQL